MPVQFDAFECMMTHSTCYRNTSRMTVKGVLWHSTGANNPWLKRYVQPYEGDKDYQKKLDKLGVNRNRNDWNHIEKQAGLNCWIGKFDDGSVGTVQTLPWDFRPWGCGTRYSNGGSCNDGWIQFEICEDNLKDKAYAQAVWDEAVRFTAWVCEKYNLDPLGTATHKSGKKVPVILDHKTSWELGLGSGHGDIRHWFPKILGKDMQEAREEVKKLMGGVAPKPSKYPDVPFQITIKESGKTGMRASGYSDGKYLGTIGSGTYKVDQLNNDFGHIPQGWVYLIDQNIVIGDNVPKSLDGYTVGGTYTIVAHGGVWLRSGAGTSNSKIKIMPYGTKVTVKDICHVSSKETWILTTGGWCAARFAGDIYIK